MNDEREQRSDEPTEPRVPLVILVDDDAALCAALRQTLGDACQTLCVEPRGALALLQSLEVVDVALVDCDQPPSLQAPIFQELARWPHAVCVLMSANVQKVEQLRALGVFAPLVLDKPVQQDALEAIRSASLELSIASAEMLFELGPALDGGVVTGGVAYHRPGGDTAPGETGALTWAERLAPRR